MAAITANGAAMPPAAQENATPLAAPATTPATAKRKRSESIDDAKANGASPPHSGSEGAVMPNNTSFQSLLADIILVLKSYDIKPSILDHTIPAVKDRSPSGEPSAKRKKLPQQAGNTSISQRARGQEYTSLDELLQDVEAVASQILAPIKAKESSPTGTGQILPLVQAETELLAGVLGFQDVLKDIIERESSNAKPNQDGNGAGKQRSKNQGRPDMNGVGEVVIKPAEEDDASQERRTVLTIFANAGHPRQLFSSFQQPVRVPAKNTVGHMDTSVEVLLPLREELLHQSFQTTKIVPLASEEAPTDKKKHLTFGEVFAPPPNLPSLNPPKPAKQSVTRGNVISFVQNGPAIKSTRHHTYFGQPLEAGKWLGYGGVEPVQEPTTPGERRKQRDRALSMGEANPPMSAATKASIFQAKEDALFRSAYSGFAPSGDNSNAIVPEETKSRIWWQKSGEQQFLDTTVIDPALLEGEQNGTTVESETDLDEEEKMFAKAVEEYEPEPLKIAQPLDPEEAAKEKEIEELLDEVSEALETIYSMQRIRTSSIASNSRTPVGQSSSLTGLTGSPTTPSQAETDIYEMLKSQLSILISMLPPYAVAKLNGDKLERLNLSQKVVTRTPNYHGVMEEDQISRMAKQSALSAAAGSSASVPPRMGAGPGPAGAPHQYPTLAGQYGARPVSTPAHSTTQQVPPHLRGPQPQSYYPQQQAPNVPRSNNASYARPASGSGGATHPQAYQASPMNYQQQRPGVGGHPTPHYQTPQQQYHGHQHRPPHPPSSAGYPSHHQQVQQHYNHPASAYGARPASQQYASNGAPVASALSPSPQPPRPRTVSPLKPATTATAGSAQPSASGYAQGGGGQARSMYFPPGQQTAAVAAEGSAAAVPTSTPTPTLTTEHQLLRERQRAQQLAAQPQARVAAQQQVGAGPRAMGASRQGQQQQQGGAERRTGGAGPGVGGGVNGSTENWVRFKT
ncbi:hypothetical protein BDY21DRAFT_362294 [Lineolata rhizophorae]|uniref:Uncharacterized protein n=1 Tax=Lineolata rhizophorae TaxID=578093 RepID=A0A6A6P6Z8_9PEZI|nr:hypothetical protein BDY21DRAFT_362294 [Lineolata rhizophorae]